jgi:hypothetical protein
MKTKLICLLIALICLEVENTSAQNLFGEIAGIVKDPDGNPVPGAIISYIHNGKLQGTIADENGRYRLKPLDAGVYDLVFSCMSFERDTVEQVKVGSAQITVINFSFSNSSNTLGIVDVFTWKDLFTVDPIVSSVIDEEEIENFPASTVQDIISSVAGVSSNDSGSPVNVRGSRSDATQYYVDGVKMIGSFFIPRSAIKEISVITGGLPAMFGDATGGIIVITTKSYWDH